MFISQYTYTFIYYIGKKIIHTQDCHHFCPSPVMLRCPPCVAVVSRLSIRKRRYEQIVQRNTSNSCHASSSTNYKCLLKEELKVRLQNVHAKLKLITKERNRLQKRLKTELENSTLKLNEIGSWGCKKNGFRNWFYEHDSTREYELLTMNALDATNGSNEKGFTSRNALASSYDKTLYLFYFLLVCNFLYWMLTRIMLNF